MKRNKIIQVRVNEKELEQIQTRAKLFGYSISDFIRIVAIKSKFEVITRFK